MGHGWLIVNHFLQSEKFVQINAMLADAAHRCKLQLKSLTHLEAWQFIAHDPQLQKVQRPAFILFWDKDIRLAHYLENCGFRLFNSAQAIACCDDKAETFLRLQNSGLALPKTLILPHRFHPINWQSTQFTETLESTFGFPFVLKECFGSFGQQVALIRDREQLIHALDALDDRPALAQALVQSSFGRDLRLHVVGDTVVTAMYRYSVNGDFRANVTNGGQMRPHTPTNAEQTLAVKACHALGLDFAGVDLLFGNDDQPMLCEVNSNAHFKNILDCTGVNVADHIMQYIRRTCQ